MGISAAQFAAQPPDLSCLQVLMSSSKVRVMPKLKNTLGGQGGPWKLRKYALKHLNILENSPSDPCPRSTAL